MAALKPGVAVAIFPARGLSEMPLEERKRAVESSLRRAGLLL